MVATFGEASAVTSKKDIVKEGMSNSKSFKNYELYLSHSFIFALQQ